MKVRIDRTRSYILTGRIDYLLATLKIGTNSRNLPVDDSNIRFHFPSERNN